jgi:hypothetical protein
MNSCAPAGVPPTSSGSTSHRPPASEASRRPGSSPARAAPDEMAHGRPRHLHPCPLTPDSPSRLRSMVFAASMALISGASSGPAMWPRSSSRCPVPCADYAEQVRSGQVEQGFRVAGGDLGAVRGVVQRAGVGPPVKHGTDMTQPGGASFEFRGRGLRIAGRQGRERAEARRMRANGVSGLVVGYPGQRDGLPGREGLGGGGDDRQDRNVTCSVSGLRVRAAGATSGRSGPGSPGIAAAVDGRPRRRRLV